MERSLTQPPSVKDNCEMSRIIIFKVGALSNVSTKLYDSLQSHASTPEQCRALIIGGDTWSGDKHYPASL
jgi:hypothetical protein